MKLKKFAVAVALTMGTIATGLQAAELPAGPHVATSGSASIEVAPDIATLTIMVTASEKEAASAKNEVDARVAKYFDFLVSNGIEKRDINAANLSTQPEYNYSKVGTPELKGYRADRQIRVVVRQLDKLNTLLDGALKANLNEIRAVELGVAKPDLYQEEVRQKAIANAIAQAKSLAKGFDMQLGTVYSVSYHVANYQPVPVTRMRMAADMASKTNAQQTYEQQFISFDDQVDVVFNLSK